jgi:autotransporter-associated beta strand protein
VGTIKVGSATAVPSTTVLTLGQADQNAVSFDLNNFDQTIAGVSISNSTATTGSVNIKQITNSSATTKTLTINNASANTFTNTNTINQVLIAGNLNLNKTGTGTLTLTGGAGTGQNTYTGSTTIAAGTLALGIADRLPDATTIILSGGTFSTGGFNETVGALNMTASSTINLGTAASILHFANSSAQSWTPGTTLTISNWSGTTGVGGGTDQVFAGSDATGLTAQQLSQITFTGFTPGAQILPSGEIVPAPEPATAGLLAMAAVGLLSRRCRQRR